MHLLNGNKIERQRNSEGCRILECGCACTDVAWLQMCDAHYAGHFEAHRRAQADHAAQSRPQE